MDKYVRKKLAQMGKSLINKDQNTQKLKNLGKDKELNLDKIFDINSSNLSAGKDDELIKKIDRVISLIKINIKLANGHANFDTEEYVIDKNTVFDVKIKYTSTGIKPAKNALKDMNKIYNKHKRLSKLLSNNSSI
jgi:hypothetical protein